MSCEGEKRQIWFLSLGPEINDVWGLRNRHDYLGHKLCLWLSQPPPLLSLTGTALARGMCLTSVLPRVLGFSSCAVWHLLAQLVSGVMGGEPGSPLAGVSRAIVLPQVRQLVPHPFRLTFVLCPCGVWGGVQPGRSCGLSPKSTLGLLSFVRPRERGGGISAEQGPLEVPHGQRSQKFWTH